MNIIKKIFFAIAISLLILPLSIVSATPANPDDITVDGVKVFQNIFETGDVLFVIAYDIDYASEPTEDCEDIFTLNLYDTDGADLFKARNISFYQENFSSIYYDATDATANLTWGNDYVVKVSGNPLVFSTLTEGTNVVTETLSEANWIIGDNEDSLEYLRLHIIDIMEDMEVALSEDYVELVSGVKYVTLDGMHIVLTNINNINNVITDLFQITRSTYPYTAPSASDDALEDATTISTVLGSNADVAFTGIGTYLGISENMTAGMFWALIVATVISIAYFNSDNSTGSLIIALPFIALGVVVGFIPVAMALTVLLVMIAMIGFFVVARIM